MPAKKSSARPQPQPQSMRSMDSNAVWKWVYLAGLIVAGLVGAFKVTAAEPYLGWLLLLAGILSAVFFLDPGDVVNFAIRYLLLVAVAEGLKALVFGSFDLGGYFTGFFQGVVGFLTPVGLTLLVMYFWKKYFSSMM